jgi:TonB family protein
MKLYQAILVSLLCHGILLLLSAGQFLPDVAFAPVQVVMSVNDQILPRADEAVSHPRSQPDNRQAKTATRTESVTPIKKATKQTALQEQHKSFHSSDTANNSTAHTANADSSRQHAQSYVISRLHRQINNYFVYPLLARRNGWEGKVILALDVNLNGQIQNVQVKAGSGHPVLDRSAISAVSRIPAIPDMPYWQGPSLLNIDIPVIYRLQG